MILPVAEMAEEEEDEDEQGGGMTDEQQGKCHDLSSQNPETDHDAPDAVVTSEQMALSLSIAKPLLSDLKPPIPDEKIQESLWYYYFDVEKCVNYLRKEREKGE